MSVDQDLFPPGTRVRFVRVGMPFIGRVVEDDPVNRRAKVRAETQLGLMHTYAMTTSWVEYDRMTRYI